MSRAFVAGFRFGFYVGGALIGLEVVLRLRKALIYILRGQKNEVEKADSVNCDECNACDTNTSYEG